MQSLFGRLSRYPRSPKLDPRENRLTETTAAVLERVDGAPWAVVLALLDAAIHAAERRAVASGMPPTADIDLLRASRAACALLTGAQATVSTQVSTSNGRFVDMAVSLRADAHPTAVPNMLVWFEVKYGADMHGDQASAYLRAIRTLPAEHRVVLLLAPRGLEIKGALPAEIPIVHWQTVARTIKEMHDRLELSDVERWLLDEYVTYLDEEGLMDPDALTADDASALARFGDAVEAIAGVCEHAHATVMGSWAKPQAWLTPRGASQEPDYGLEFWASYDATPHSANWCDGWFDWGVGTPEAWQYYETARPDTIAFFAGVGFRTRANPYNEPKNETWVATLLNNGFAWCWFDGAYRLVRALYPDELLIDGSLEAQGRHLGTWVVDTFKVLNAHPPEH